MSVSISITGKLEEELRAVAAQLEGPGRELLHRAMGEEVQNTTFNHLSLLAQTRHRTAQRLGATPSNHLAQAAEKVAEPQALTAAGDSATLTIHHVGMIRALRDVEITPQTGKALAIPIHALGYNRRPAQFSRDTFFVFVSKTTGNAFLALRQPEKHAKPILVYALVRSVHQKQDRTLLPSQQEWEAAAARGAETEIIRVINKRAGLA
jgi:hypothetical protein